MRRGSPLSLPCAWGFARVSLFYRFFGAFLRFWWFLGGLPRFVIRPNGFGSKASATRPYSLSHLASYVSRPNTIGLNRSYKFIFPLNWTNSGCVQMDVVLGRGLLCLVFARFGGWFAVFCGFWLFGGVLVSRLPLSSAHFLLGLNCT